MLSTKKRKASAPQKQRPLLHPFALPPKRLRQAVKELAGDLPGCQDSKISLMLPSGSQGPLPSPELIYQEEAGRQAPKTLKPWALPSLALSPAQALRLLGALPSTLPHGISTGASLHYWAEAAKLCLENLAQGHFLPDVEKEPDGRLRARWRPVLKGDGVPERLRLLVWPCHRRAVPGRAIMEERLPWACERRPGHPGL